MRELTERLVRYTEPTSKLGCYQCENFDKKEEVNYMSAIIKFKDGSFVKLCGRHFIEFEQKRR